VQDDALQSNPKCNKRESARVDKEPVKCLIKELFDWELLAGMLSIISIVNFIVAMPKQWWTYVLYSVLRA
jgi:hypothetical protein